MDFLNDLMDFPSSHPNIVLLLIFVPSLLFLVCLREGVSGQRFCMLVLETFTDFLKLCFRLDNSFQDYRGEERRFGHESRRANLRRKDDQYKSPVHLISGLPPAKSYRHPEIASKEIPSSLKEKEGDHDV